MAAASSSAVLALAAELERRDQAIAGELDAVRELEERVGALRARAEDIRGSLARIPLELDDLRRRGREAADDAETAERELERAEARLAGLESGRRSRTEELERARKEAATARDALGDARSRVERVEELATALRADEHALRGEERSLVEAAAALAGDLRQVSRIAEDARREPGATLADLDDWGGQARSALFVARGTLEAERERVVVEANVLGSSVLGEPLGASGVALVRRRLEVHLGGQDVDISTNDPGSPI
jgi:chromosome segregation ATPase